MLNVLGKYGITSLLIEGGHDLVQSFYNQQLIDEIFIYTSNNIIENASLENPIKISDEDWTTIEEKKFNNDKLKVVRRKELCFQEL